MCCIDVDLPWSTDKGMLLQKLHLKIDKDMGMDQYLLIPFLGEYEHPFTSYFGVH